MFSVKIWTLSFTAPVEISADSVEHNRANNTFTARGNVDLKEGSQSLTADYVFYNDNTKDVFAEGNVIFKEEEDRVECDRLTLNLETKEGTLENRENIYQEGKFLYRWRGYEEGRRIAVQYGDEESLLRAVGTNLPGNSLPEM